MKILVAVWKNYNENPADFKEMTDRHSGLSFGTILHGGFGTATFKIEVGGYNAIRWYRDYVGHHVVIFDHLGRRLYEGRIDATDADASGVKVACVGYYAHAQDLTHGIIYPAGVPTSISEMIEDTVDLSDQWWTTHAGIKTTVTDITPQDFTGEQKLRDAVEQTTKFGDDGVIPVPIFFAIWDHRQPFLFAQPSITADEPDWQVFVRDFGGTAGVTLSRNRRQLFNKVQVLYDDPDIGPTFTAWEEDLVSQGLFGVREGSLNIGGALPGIANTMAELAINSYSKPTQASRLSISGRVYTQAGAPEYPYMVRAGTLVRVNDYDPTVAQVVSSESGEDAAVAFINRTSYSADKNTLKIELGKKNVALDLLMARLGMGSASIR
jgi:hypothetical protein